MTKKDWIEIILEFAGLLAIEGVAVYGLVQIYRKGVNARIEDAGRLMDKLVEVKNLKDEVLKEQEEEDNEEDTMENL